MAQVDSRVNQPRRDAVASIDVNLSDALKRPFTPFRMVLAQDIAFLTALGFACMFYPRTVAWLSNWLASAMKLPGALVLKSDTSYMLLKVIGATQLAFAWGILFRHWKNNNLDAGVGVALFHLCQFLLLTLVYWTGGSTHKLLLPFIAHNLFIVAGLSYILPSPAQKALRSLVSSGAGNI